MAKEEPFTKRANKEQKKPKWDSIVRSHKNPLAKVFGKLSAQLKTLLFYVGVGDSGVELGSDRAIPEDLPSRAPRLANMNLGIFICMQCSGIHSSLGVHISKVRSATLDTWLPEQVAYIQCKYQCCFTGFFPFW
ncbi:hypothetical protein ACFX2I_036260 [Malus domestica]